MECVKGDWSTFWKLETEENNSSPELITYRKDGNWFGGCGSPNVICSKGDESVVVTTTKNGDEIKMVYDFKFLFHTFKGLDMDVTMKCKKMHL